MIPVSSAWWMSGRNRNSRNPSPCRLSNQKRNLQTGNWFEWGGFPLYPSTKPDGNCSRRWVGCNRHAAAVFRSRNLEKWQDAFFGNLDDVACLNRHIVPRIELRFDAVHAKGLRPSVVDH